MNTQIETLSVDEEIDTCKGIIRGEDTAFVFADMIKAEVNLLLSCIDVSVSQIEAANVLLEHAAQTVKKYGSIAEAISNRDARREKLEAWTECLKHKLRD